MNFNNYKNEDYVYIYAHHLGEWNYISKVELDFQEIYCEECRSIDALIDEGYIKDLKIKYEGPVKVLK